MPGKIRKTTRVGSNFTMLHNDCFRGLLTAAEIAILGYGLSHDDGFAFDRERLNTTFDDLGKTRLEKALQGLRRKGFIEVTKLRAADGCFEWEWDFTPDPTFAAKRSKDNPDGDIIDETKENAQVTPHPQNEGVVPPAEIPEPGQNGAKPDPRFPGDGEPGDGEGGSGLNKEEKNTREEQPPPTPPDDLAAPSPVTAEQGGEDDTNVQELINSGGALVRRVFAHEREFLEQLRADARSRFFAIDVGRLLARGEDAARIESVLGRSRSGLGDPVAGVHSRVRSLLAGSTPQGDQDDPFGGEDATEGPGGAVPKHCGRCSGGPRSNPAIYRHVINEDGSYGEICTCHPDHPDNHPKEAT